jgi:hypothetical protein
MTDGEAGAPEQVVSEKTPPATPMPASASAFSVAALVMLESAESSPNEFGETSSSVMVEEESVPVVGVSLKRRLRLGMDMSMASAERELFLWKFFLSIFFFLRERGGSLHGCI